MIISCRYRRTGAPSSTWCVSVRLFLLHQDQVMAVRVPESGHPQLGGRGPVHDMRLVAKLDARGLQTRPLGVDVVDREVVNGPGDELGRLRRAQIQPDATGLEERHRLAL